MRIVFVLRSFRRAQYGRAAMSGSRDLGLAKFAFSGNFLIFLRYISVFLEIHSSALFEKKSGVIF